MKSVDPGILDHSICFSFTPSALAEQLYFYMTWCGHYYSTSRYMMKRDYYPPLLVMYIREGIMHVEHMGQKFDAQKGDVVLIDCSNPHYYQAENGLEFTFIHFDGSNSHEIVEHILSVRGPLIRSKNNLLIGNFLYNTVYFYENGGIENMFATSMRIYRLLQMLNDLDDYSTPSEESPVHIAIRYIRDNVGKKITLQELADLSNLSIYYFSHRFKDETGYSPMDYVINSRMDKAKILLIRTSKTITEIAYEVGYGSSGSFINIFSDKVGCSPKIFRRLMR
ncbi:helix-turn-helix transcriptional regulator [Ruminococcus gauvreauii]|uniref:AraC family transcriptional regulator n=1 Tax=Ruminococcus gauvreauii TaxID=438033 RepID=A0ABY5VLC3_9FIRM|nr:AraC family transcriptional regulator [Ruminococcus gauvreauii]UWP61217.1 AraC family transcriptional regulator [Ruminococcus gauvreauii]